MLRDLATGEPVTWTRTGADGSYTINAPSSLPVYVLADNFTLQAYGSGAYNGPQAGGATPVSGVVGIDRATVVIPTAAGTLSANFALIPGRRIVGIVTDGAATPSPVPGIAVRFFDNTGVFVTALRANLAGEYRVWLQPNAASAAYVVRARGQTASADLSAGAVVADFNAVVNSKSGTLTSDGTTPVSQAKVQVYDAATGNFEGFEITNGDGSVTVFTTSAATVNKKIQVIVDGPQAGVATTWCCTNTAVSRGTADLVLFDNTSVGTATLPAGATLSGTVTLAGSPVNGDYVVQVFSNTVSAANFVAGTRAQGDGSYSLNLQSGTYQVRVCLWSAAPCTATAQSVTIANPPADAILDFAM
jgi:hypothetical protein